MALCCGLNSGAVCSSAQPHVCHHDYTIQCSKKGKAFNPINDDACFLQQAMLFDFIKLHDRIIKQHWRLVQDGTPTLAANSFQSSPPAPPPSRLRPHPVESGCIPHGAERPDKRPG